LYGTALSALGLAKSELASMTALFETQKMQHKALVAEKTDAVEALTHAEARLQTTESELAEAAMEREEHEHVLGEFEKANETLGRATGKLADVLSHARRDDEGLCGKLERKAGVERTNEEAIAAIKESVAARLIEMEERLTTGTFYTLVPIRPRSRGERRSLRTLRVVSLRPGSLAFNPRHTSAPFNSN
jgi:chromosome segregation ATPase